MIIDYDYCVENGCSWLVHISCSRFSCDVRWLYKSRKRWPPNGNIRVCAVLLVEQVGLVVGTWLAHIRMPLRIWWLHQHLTFISNLLAFQSHQLLCLLDSSATNGFLQLHAAVCLSRYHSSICKFFLIFFLSFILHVASTFDDDLIYLTSRFTWRWATSC